MADDVFGIVGTTQGGTFTVERAIAEGGFSVVYKAQHSAFRAPVALKCLKVPTELGGPQREAYLEKFRDEAEILFRLSASIPEIVRPLHVGTLDREDLFVPFLALEWLEGEALDELIWRRRSESRAPMSLIKLFKLLTPIANALARAHRFPGPAGPIAIVHCDIKPENILVARLHGREIVKVLDFGIATAMDAARRNAAGAQAPAPDSGAGFTPRTGAPEQWLPDIYGATGPWTDVWGLAITMVEVLAGEPPIGGSFAAMRQHILDEKRRPTPRAHGVVLSDESEAAFQRALAVRPADRTQDVATFWRELEEALGPAVSMRGPSGPTSPRARGSPSIPRVDPPSDNPLSFAAARVDAQGGGPPSFAPAVDRRGGGNGAVMERIAVPDASPAPAARDAPTITGSPTPSDSLAGAPFPGSPTPRGSPAGAPFGSSPAAVSASPSSGSALAEPALAATFELADSAQTFRTRPAVLAGHAPPPRFRSAGAEAMPAAAGHGSLRAPIRLLVLGSMVSIGDVVAREVLSEPVSIASVRPLWVGAALLALGVALFVWRLLTD